MARPRWPDYRRDRDRCAGDAARRPQASYFPHLSIRCSRRILRSFTRRYVLAAAYQPALLPARSTHVRALRSPEPGKLDCGVGALDGVKAVRNWSSVVGGWWFVVGQNQYKLSGIRTMLCLANDQRRTTDDRS